MLGRWLAPSKDDLAAPAQLEGSSRTESSSDAAFLEAANVGGPQSDIAQADSGEAAERVLWEEIYMLGDEIARLDVEQLKSELGGLEAFEKRWMFEQVGKRDPMMLLDLAGEVEDSIDQLVVGAALESVDPVYAIKWVEANSRDFGEISERLGWVYRKWIQEDPMDAIAFVAQSVDDSKEYQASTAQLFATIANEGDLTLLNQAVDEVVDERNWNRVGLYALGNLVRLDPLSAIDWLERQPSDQFREDHLGETLGAYVEKDVQGAAEIVNMYAAKPYYEGMLTRVILAYQESDPEGCRQWVASLGRDGVEGKVVAEHFERNAPPSTR